MSTIRQGPGKRSRGGAYFHLEITKGLFNNCAMILEDHKARKLLKTCERMTQTKPPVWSPASWPNFEYILVRDLRFPSPLAFALRPKRSGSLYSSSQSTHQTKFRQIWQLRGGPNLLAWLNHAFLGTGWEGVGERGERWEDRIHHYRYQSSYLWIP